MGGKEGERRTKETLNGDEGVVDLHMKLLKGSSRRKSDRAMVDPLRRGLILARSCSTV